MRTFTVTLLITWLAVALFPVYAQDETELTQDLLKDPDTQILQLHGAKEGVTISGVSSGAAMAVQYAVAHSASIAGVGSIAGPRWGCAKGSFSIALGDCMCGRGEIAAHITETERQLLTNSSDFDQLLPDPDVPGRMIPSTLKHFFAFHSPADATVTYKPGDEAITFLNEFIPNSRDVDRGQNSDNSNHAGHGILSPNGEDSCEASNSDNTYIRKCGDHDNAGRLFNFLYGNIVIDRGQRETNSQNPLFTKFKQTPFINELQAPKPGKPYIASDLIPIGHSNQRLNFDLAEEGYLYVPGKCRAKDSHCRVHVALHGCKQDPEVFARKAGYNLWADRYNIIVIYPAISAYKPFEIQESNICQDSRFIDPEFIKAFEGATSKINYNGCWDWWGYLDLQSDKTMTYLTKRAPQQRFLKMVIDMATH